MGLSGIVAGLKGPAWALGGEAMGEAEMGEVGVGRSRSRRVRGGEVVRSEVPPRPLTVAEVAGRLGMSDGFVRGLIRKGELRHFRFSGAIRVPLEEVDRYIRAAEIRAVEAGVGGAELVHIRL